MSEPPLSAIRDEIEAGNLILAYDRLAPLVADGRAGADGAPRYLYVLTLARMGLTQRALDAYGDLGLESETDEDSQALYARLLKDVALSLPGDRRAALRRAAGAYDAVFARTGGSFPAVNAASLYLMAGEPAQARALAQAVLTLPPDQPDDYYTHATRAEAHVVLGALDAAGQELALACADHDAGLGARAGTRTQLERLLAARGLPGPEIARRLDCLRIGTAIVYAGRMFREDPDVERALRAQVGAFVEDQGVSAAFGSLACGADIVICEELLARDVPVTVVLASPPETFVATSVAIGGPGWASRFDACLAAASDLLVTGERFHASDPLAFALVSTVANGMAAGFARQNSCALHRLAVLGGNDSAGGSAGTNADIDRWKAHDWPMTVLRAEGIVRPSAGRDTTPQDALPQDMARRAVSMMFADFAGFSSLEDRALPGLLTGALGTLSDLIDAAGERILFRNTWGDAAFIVFDDPLDAARLSLDLLDRLAASEIRHVVDGLRISLHHGIVLDVFDPVLGRRNYFGNAVSTAARIEPVTPANSIYASQQFASVAMDRDPDALRFDYVGRVPLAKDFGDERLYLLRRPALTERPPEP